MSHEHDCLTSGCCGKDFYGISLTCQNCFKPYFLECLKHRQEVIELTTAFGMANIPNSQSANTFTYKVKKLFETGSIFEFICIACKTQGSRMEHSQNHKKHIDELNQQLAASRTSLDELNQKYNEIGKKCDKELTNSNDLAAKLSRANEQLSFYESNAITLNGQIAQLQVINNDLKSQLDGYQAQGESHQMVTNENDPVTNSSLATANEQLLIKIIQAFSNTTGELENRIANEFSVFRDLSSSDNENTKKRKRTLDGMSQSLQPNATTISPLQQALLTHPPPPIQRPSIILHPPSEDKTVPKGVFEIHISKFRNDTSEESISEYILERSSIKDPNLFTVELLVKRNEDVKRKKHVSFKVTTLRHKVYEILMDERLWAPNFSARDFSKNNDRPTNINKYTNNRQISTNESSPLRSAMRSSGRSESGIVRQRSARVNFNDSANRYKRNVNTVDDHNTPRSSRRATSRPNNGPVRDSNQQSYQPQSVQYAYPGNSNIGPISYAPFLGLPHQFGQQQIIPPQYQWSQPQQQQKQLQLQQPQKQQQFVQSQSHIQN